MSYSISWKQENKSQEVVLKQQSFMIGSLLSSHIQIQGDGVEPIHALLELRGDEWLLTDLGAIQGVYVNGNKIAVEKILKPDDKIKIGSVVLLYRFNGNKKSEISLDTEVDIEDSSPTPETSKLNLASSTKISAKPTSFTDFKTNVNLFAKNKTVETGDTIEVIAYWKNTVLNVEHFQYKKGENFVTIGDPTKANFIAAGPANLVKYNLAKIHSTGSRLSLLQGMQGNLRRNGVMESVGEGHFELKNGDFAKIQYGPVTYFFLFTKLPNVHLPRTGPQDPLFLGISIAAMLIYIFLIGTILVVDVQETKPKKEEDLWAVVQAPEPEKPMPPAPKPLEEVKKAPVPAPIEPPPQPMAAVPPKEVKPVEKKPPPPKPNVEQVLTQAKTQEKKKPVPAAGGGMQAAGGEKKGKEKTSTPGSDDGVIPKPAGTNLSQLGLGVGKISSKTGPGAIQTNFKSSPGGVGKSSGSADKNYGLGGLAGSKSLAVGGSGSALNQFGTGEGVVGDGKGVSQAFKGKGQVAIDVRAGDPLVSGGLSQEEILKVIRANLNQIKNCYERWLQRVPDANGKMKVQWVVGLDGSVLKTSVASGTISDSVMTDCILSRIQKWKFAEPRGGKAVTVNYPFNFDPI